MLLFKILYLLIATTSSLAQGATPGDYCLPMLRVPSKDGRVLGKFIYCLRVDADSNPQFILKVAAAEYFRDGGWHNANSKYPYAVSAELLFPANNGDYTHTLARGDKLGGPKLLKGDHLPEKVTPGKHAYQIQYTQHGPFWNTAGSEVRYSDIFTFEIPAAS